VILKAYRLAKEYGQNPQVFLDKSFSQIERDYAWTERLYEGERIEVEWQEKLNE
jgi:hypothetical protein